MSSPTSDALPYEPQRVEEDAVWRALRLATILWSAAFAVRHGLYWTAIAAPGMRYVPSLATAGVESIVLLAILITALMMPTRAARATSLLAMLGGLMVALAAVGVVVETLRFPMARPGSLAFVARVGWLGVTRLATLAPAIAWIALALRPRRA